MKAILDACCGGKMFYFDHNDPRVLFQDIRSFKDKDIYKGRTFSVEPDIVADFTSMPYPDNSFNMVVFDPPHLKYTPPQGRFPKWVAGRKIRLASERALGGSANKGIL